MPKDLFAGFTVAVILIPQAMAYATLAGLPPTYGLYAAAFSPFIGSLFGSLRQLSTGPVAIMSLLVLTTLAPLAEPGSPEYVEQMFLLALMVGGLYLALGFFGLGRVMSFISHSSVKGFTAAATLIIIATQLPNLFGIHVSHHEYIFPMLVETAMNLKHFNFVTTLLGASTFLFIYYVKRYKSTLPAGLIALALASGAYLLFGMERCHVVIVGPIPSGLPGFHSPSLDIETITQLGGPMLVIALVAFAETYSVSRSVAARTKQKVDVNQELIGQGIANLLCAFFQGYPVGGSFSRTAVNYSAGAKTGLSGLVSSLVVILALLFLTPLFAFIPKAALSALIVSAVLLLFHPAEVFKLWKMNRHDGIVAVTVFVLSLLVKPDYALLIGVMISLMLFLWKTTHPRIVEVTRDPDTHMFHNVRSGNAPRCRQLRHLRIDSEIYFGNAEFLLEHIEAHLDKDVRFVLLNFQGVSFIDITGLEELRILKEDLARKGTELAFVGIHKPVMQVFESSGFKDEVDPSLIFASKEDAVSSLIARLDKRFCEDCCDQRVFHECRQR